MTKGKPYVAEWQLQKVPHVDLESEVIERSRTADLIIAAQADRDWDFSLLMDFPEQLALGSGRPVLVIPYVGRYPAVGSRVVIAWKPSREAARAVFDAMPLLREAQAVHILEIKDREEAETRLPAGTSLAETLGRHGVKAEVRTSIAVDIGVGDELLSRAADLDADLLVMGAYGHARFREIIFGGTTRYIAQHMTLPTLFSY
jgi:nucleotide-binding universal stress UspA family protein